MAKLCPGPSGLDAIFALDKLLNEIQNISFKVEGRALTYKLYSKAAAELHAAKEIEALEALAKVMRKMKL